MRYTQPHSISKTKIFLIIINIIFIIGISFWVFSNLSESKKSGIVKGISETRQQNISYKYINPLLDARGITNAPDIFEEELNDSLASVIKDNPEITASIYFSDLTNQDQVSVNGNEKYNLASLIKVPLMIAYYKLAEDDPELLSKEL